MYPMPAFDTELDGCGCLGQAGSVLVATIDQNVFH
jgi:hypothetical protein